MKPHPIFHSELKLKTRVLLLDHLKNATYDSVAKATKLSPTWVAMLARNELKHTDVGRVETLYNFLSPTVLKV